LKQALLKLTRELRARAESLDAGDWVANPVGERPASQAVGAAQALEALERTVEACRLCPLGSQRIRPAYGVGSHEAEVLFIGEGPGYEEDRRGEPFVGKAGQLLDRILASIGLSRKTVYIANIVKCHPMVDPSRPEKRGNDRPPTPDEIAACRGYLDEQIRLIRPRFLVTLGAVASKVMLRTETGITRLRGQWREYELENVTEAASDPELIPLLPTFHPAALLRNPDLKRDVWNDMKSLKRRLEEA